MSDGNYKDDEAIILQLANYAIVLNTEAPKMGQTVLEGMSE